MDRGTLNSYKTFNFAGYGRTVPSRTTYPNIYTSLMKNSHLAGDTARLAPYNNLKTSSKFPSSCSSVLAYTIMSSRYTKHFDPRMGDSTMFINFWNVTTALVRPNYILLQAKVPRKHVNVVYGIEFFAILIYQYPNVRSNAAKC